MHNTSGTRVISNHLECVDRGGGKFSVPVTFVRQSCFDSDAPADAPTWVPVPFNLPIERCSNMICCTSPRSASSNPGITDDSISEQVFATTSSELPCDTCHLSF